MAWAKAVGAGPERALLVVRGAARHDHRRPFLAGCMAPAVFLLANRERRVHPKRPWAEDTGVRGRRPARGHHDRRSRGRPSAPVLMLPRNLDLLILIGCMLAAVAPLVWPP